MSKFDKLMGGHLDWTDWLTVAIVIAFVILKDPAFWRWVFFFFLNRKNPKPDEIQTADKLRKLGYTEAQIKRELRAQRGEQRSSAWLRNSNIRTSGSVFRKRR